MVKTFACGLATLLLFPSAMTLAQDARLRPTPPEKPKAVTSGQTWELDIAGGVLRRQDGGTVAATLGAVVEYLRDLYPANVVLAPGVGDIKIADLKLASFKWETALEALRVASGDAFIWTCRPENPGSSPIDPGTGLPTGQSVTSADDLLVLTPNEAASASRSKRVVEVFNMSGYLRGQNADKVTDNLNRIIEAISETLAQLHEGSPVTSAGPRFKYHDVSALFIVIGSPEEVEVARRIVLALPETSGTKDPEQQAGPDERFLRRYGMPAPPPSSNTPGAPGRQRF